MSKERLYSRGEFICLIVGAGLAAYEANHQFEKIEEACFLFGHKPQLTEKEPLSAKEIEEFKDAEALLVFCPGGFGHTSLEEDPGWKELLENIQNELENQGYKTKILEERRQKSYFSSFSVENTVMKIKQLTGSFPDLKIILTGRSTGALFVENVLKFFPENPRILAIEAGRPLRERIAPFAPKKTFEVQNGQDCLEAGNILSIFLANLPPETFIGEGGNWGIGPLRFNLQAPGHTTFLWKPQMMEELGPFLQTHFPTKTKL